MDSIGNNKKVTNKHCHNQMDLAKTSIMNEIGYRICHKNNVNDNDITNNSHNNKINNENIGTMNKINNNNNINELVIRSGNEQQPNILANYGTINHPLENIKGHTNRIGRNSRDDKCSSKYNHI